jgi:hypothetical protein
VVQHRRVLEDRRQAAPVDGRQVEAHERVGQGQHQAAERRQDGPHHHDDRRLAGTPLAAHGGHQAHHTGDRGEEQQRSRHPAPQGRQPVGSRGAAAADVGDVAEGEVVIDQGLGQQRGGRGETGDRDGEGPDRPPSAARQDHRREAGDQRQPEAGPAPGRHHGAAEDGDHRRRLGRLSGRFPAGRAAR